MNFRQLNYILKVAEIGNVTRAAEELFITQPALSHYISKVEKEIGIPLFQRTTTAMTLTLAGEKYVTAAKKILQISNNLREELSDIAVLKKGRIVMGIPPARAAYILPHIVPQFMKKYPGVQLKTLEKNSHILKEAILTGKVDFALLPYMNGNDDLEAEPLFMEELYLVAKKGILNASNLKSENVIDFESIKEMPFVMLRTNRGIRNMIDIIFMEYGMTANIVMETSSNESAYRLASTGIGIAIVPAMTIAAIKSEEDVYDGQKKISNLENIIAPYC